MKISALFYFVVFPAGVEWDKMPLAMTAWKL
jgi:hypothetical protein